ncbi:hypothetical protein LZP73_05335 [Shewanella sp. AS16]|uniref:hypothetical protein n=1 Tax=Shewanella sp. AS16 TaxID=2907625 RepID=UPI001F36F9C6|nr:hypothetical protein [Shewanella sp. AS16]MCE9685639.1 hypothetical protein [Shewanella sp. AS16]
MITPSLTLERFKAIKTYFYENDSTDAYKEAFNEDVVVIDDMKQYTGINEILAWRREAYRRYSHTTTPIQVDISGDKITVIALVVGNFSGSPINLQFEFYIQNEKIIKLEIKA